MQPAPATPTTTLRAEATAETPASRAAPLDRPRSGLSERSRRIAWAAAEAILCDEDEHGALVPASQEVCEHAVWGLGDSLIRTSPELRRAFGVLAILLEILPLFVIGAPHRMSRLPLDRRLAYLEALENSRFGLLCMLFIAFKVPLCVPAFEQEDLLRSTGFDRDHLASRRLPIAAPPRREAA